MNPSHRSLRLCEVMEEEYQLLHNKAISVEPSLEFIKLIDEDELLQRLQEYRTAASYQQSVSVPDPQEPQQKGGENAGPKKAASPTDVRYEMLAKWLCETNQAYESLPEPDLLKLIREVLEKKLGEDLAGSQRWMWESPLRPHTRGLLKCYKQRHAISAWMRSRIQKQIPQNWKPKADPQRVSAATDYAAEEKLLNRLLLEDAFVGYVQRYDDRRLEEVFGGMHDAHQTALCLSGGGIRSATFALGISQGLARHKLLNRFTYLSTVSGGGYLGGWLSAWIHYEGMDTVTQKLNGYVGTPLEPEAVPVRHLRQYSNYLNPRIGLFSADTWTLVMTYFRNLLLIWLVVMPFLAGVAAIPWLAVTLASFTNDDKLETQATVAILLAVIATIATIVGTAYVHAARPQSEAAYVKSPSSWPQRDQAGFLWWCLLPLSGAVLLWMLAWRLFESSGQEHPLLINFYNSFTINQKTGLDLTSNRKIVVDLTSVSSWRVMGGAALVHLISWGIGIQYRCQQKKGVFKYLEPVAVAATGGITGFLFLLTIKLLITLPPEQHRACAYACLAFPGILLAVLLAGCVFEGVASHFTDDAEREWSARYGAWFLIVATGWLFVMGLVLFGPAIAEKALDKYAGSWASLLSLVSGALTALLGRSSISGGSPKENTSEKEKPGFARLLTRFTLPIVAFVTLVTLLIALSFADMALLRWLHHILDESPVNSAALTIRDLATLNPAYPGILIGCLVVIGIAIGVAVDTNRFSLHAMYRSRLIRAYLGASRPPGERQPNPFTGFDEADNMPMGCVQSARNEQKGPFHVINIALNLVAGRNLAWQERKAESFTVSSRHAGAMNIGYRRTHVDDTSGCPKPLDNPLYYGGDKGISLGTAITISGAAASPNHGYNSSPLVAFLMTLFNVRLGWWLGNPGPAGDKTFHQSAPKSAITPIIDEMIGNTTDVNEYVYLSDGGHFENLGLYEMVLRRNRFVIVSDASCDETCGLEDLGNAIRKIRIDLGIPIDFPHGFAVRSRSDSAQAGTRYWALGRIRYSKAGVASTAIVGSEPDGYTTGDGILLYIKPGFMGTEPRDIFNYATSRSTFPHETTADQFFTESQFESYRALGAYIFERVQAELTDEFKISLEQLFDENEWSQCVDALNKQIKNQSMVSKGIRHQVERPFLRSNGKLTPASAYYRKR